MDMTKYSLHSEIFMLYYGDKIIYQRLLYYSIKANVVMYIKYLNFSKTLSTIV